MPKSLANVEDSKQLIKASGSVGANYIEANESLGKKDFLMHIKISRKEGKESRYWLRIIDLNSNHDFIEEQNNLVKESEELMNIFGAIYRKSDQ